VNWRDECNCHALCPSHSLILLLCFSVQTGKGEVRWPAITKNNHKLLVLPRCSTKREKGRQWMPELHGCRFESPISSWLRSFGCTSSDVI
jgi:hypothetical protein